MKNWHPDPEFFEFLAFLHKGGKGMASIGGKDPIVAFREGTPAGRKVYQVMYDSPMFQVAFQEWKQLMARLCSEGPPSHDQLK